LPSSCGLRLKPDGYIWCVNVRWDGTKRKVQDGDGQEGDCVVDHL
jgi:hypothetical protein